MLRVCHSVWDLEAEVPFVFCPLLQDQMEEGREGAEDPSLIFRKMSKLKRVCFQSFGKRGGIARRQPFFAIRRCRGRNRTIIFCNRAPQKPASYPFAWPGLDGWNAHGWHFPTAPPPPSYTDERTHEFPDEYGRGGGGRIQILELGTRRTLPCSIKEEEEVPFITRRGRTSPFG